MSVVYIEARPKGRSEGTYVIDYVVEDAANLVLHTSLTQVEAVEWAKAQGHQPHIQRIRHLNNKRSPAHWRET